MNKLGSLVENEGVTLKKGGVELFLVRSSQPPD